LSLESVDGASFVWGPLRRGLMVRVAIRNCLCFTTINNFR
jgi:hypothetical protein